MHLDNCAICKGVSHTGAKDERVECACRGVLPAVSGQFVSHGLRTFAFEGSLTGLKALSGGAAELQVALLDTCENISAHDCAVVWLLLVPVAIRDEYVPVGIMPSESA